MDLLTTRQVAERLHVDVSTISRWVTAGKLIPAVRLDNGQMLFASDDIARRASKPKTLA